VARNGNPTRKWLGTGEKEKCCKAAMGAIDQRKGSIRRETCRWWGESQTGWKRRGKSTRQRPKDEESNIKPQIWGSSYWDIPPRGSAGLNMAK